MLATIKLNVTHNINLALREIRDPPCRYCNGTGLAHCHPSTCEYHHGRACDDVDRRGEFDCPLCRVCGGTGKERA